MLSSFLHCERNVRQRSSFCLSSSFHRNHCLFGYILHFLPYHSLIIIWGWRSNWLQSLNCFLTAIIFCLEVLLDHLLSNRHPLLLYHIQRFLLVVWCWVKSLIHFEIWVPWELMRLQIKLHHVVSDLLNLLRRLFWFPSLDLCSYFLQDFTANNWSRTLF